MIPTLPVVKSPSGTLPGTLLSLLLLDLLPSAPAFQLPPWAPAWHLCLHEGTPTPECSPPPDHPLRPLLSCQSLGSSPLVLMSPAGRGQDSTIYFPFADKPTHPGPPPLAGGSEEAGDYVGTVGMWQPVPRPQREETRCLALGRRGLDPHPHGHPGRTRDGYMVRTGGLVAPAAAGRSGHALLSTVPRQTELPGTLSPLGLDVCGWQVPQHRLPRCCGELGLEDAAVTVI